MCRVRGWCRPGRTLPFAATTCLAQPLTQTSSILVSCPFFEQVKICFKPHTEERKRKRQYENGSIYVHITDQKPLIRNKYKKMVLLLYWEPVK